MDQIKIGKFIYSSRKAKEITQENLAIKLGVSKNAVSKWERGLNLPDPSLMQELCSILDITLNELFAGEHLNEKEIKKQADKNILDLLKFNNDKTKKYKILIFITLMLLVISFTMIGKNLLIKSGYMIDNNLRYSKLYIEDNYIIGDVDVNYFGKINIDFEVGANKYGKAVFKNPQKAFKTLKKDYKKGLKLIQKEFNLLPLSNFNYKSYATYGWQITTGSKEEQEQARFISAFMDIYENSFNN